MKELSFRGKEFSDSRKATSGIFGLGVDLTLFLTRTEELPTRLKKCTVTRSFFYDIII